MAQKVLSEAFAAGAVMGGHGLFAAIVDVEAGMLPSEKVGEFFRADEFGLAQGVKEAVAKEFDGGGEVFNGHAVEAAVGSEESVGGEDVEVRVEDEVVAEGVDGGDGTEFPVGQLESDAEGVAEGFSGGVEEVGEESAAFAEDAAEHLWDGEHELAVGHFVADGGGNPVARGADAALVAGLAEVAALAGEGEEPFVAAVGAWEAGEAGGEVAAAEEGFDGGGGDRVERAEIGAGRDPCGAVFRSWRGILPSRGGRVARVARRGGGGAGRWRAQRVFIKTFFVSDKDGGDGSVWGKVGDWLIFCR